MKKLYLVLIIVHGLSLLVMAQSQESRLLQMADSLGKKFSKQLTNRGLVIGIFDNGLDSVLTYGRINLLGRKTSADDLFQIGSVTKTFTGYMLAHALEMQSVQMGDPVSRYLEIKNKSKYDSVTIASLATHTSGLPNMTPLILGPPLLSYAALSIGLKRGVVIPLKAPQPAIDWPWQVLFVPIPVPFFSTYGEGFLNFDLNHANLKKRQGNWKYSNIGMGLLGKILSENQDLSYAELLEQTVCQQLGLQNTSNRPSKAQKKKYATPHNILGFRTLRTRFRSGGIEGAGDIKSTGTDMMKYLRIQIDSMYNPTGYKIASIQHATYFKSEKTKGLEMGLGWVKYNPEEAGQNAIIWHNGQVAGTSAFIGFIKEKQIGLFILANNSKANRLTKLAFKILHELNKEGN